MTDGEVLVPLTFRFVSPAGMVVAQLRGGRNGFCTVQAANQYDPLHEHFDLSISVGLVTSLGLQPPPAGLGLTPASTRAYVLLLDLHGLFFGLAASLLHSI